MIRHKLFLAFFLLIFASAVNAQHWTNVIPDLRAGKNGSDLMTPYFLNENTGFVFSPGTQCIYSTYAAPNDVPPNLRRTTDGGKTWMPLPFFDDLMLSISQMYFVNLTHGYAATMPSRLRDFIHPYLVGRDTSGIYETTDQGDHWHRIASGTFISLYAANGSIFTVERQWADTIHTPCERLLSTQNNGKHWDTVMTIAFPANDVRDCMASISAYGIQKIVGNRDSLVAVIFFDSAFYAEAYNPKFFDNRSYLAYTTNLGKTWNTKLLDSEYVFCEATLFSPPHSCQLIRQYVSTGDYFDDLYHFLRSTPDFSTWDTILRKETSAYIGGSSCVQYVPVCNFETQPVDSGIALFRTTNAGSSWDLIFTSPAFSFREMDDWDWQNLSVVGYGAVVYAADVNFGLWKCTDGGDGTLSSSMLAPKISFMHQLSDSSKDTLFTICNGGIITEIDQNLTCARTQFQHISIDGLDSSEYSIVRTHHSSCLDLPDTTVIAVNPQHDTTRYVTIHASFMDDEYATIDTSFTILMTSAMSKGRAYATSISIGPRSINAHAGDTISIPVVMSVLPASTNVTFSTASLEALKLSFNTDFLTPIAFNSLVPGASGSISNITGSSVDLSLLLSNGFSFTGQLQLGVLRCVVRVSDTMNTEVILSRCSFTSSDSGCITQSIPEGGSGVFVTLLPECGLSTLLQFMKVGKLSEFTVYPNPAENSITIQSNLEVKNAKIEIFDQLGKKVANWGSVIFNGAKKQSTFNVSSLPSGIYFLRIETEGNVRSEKININR